MALVDSDQLNGNWYIQKNVIGKLREHDEDGDYRDRRHVYIGNSEDLGKIADRFTDSSDGAKVTEARIYARRCCIDKCTSKANLLELDQVERDTNGNIVQVLEATWVTPARRPLSDVLTELNEVFRPDQDTRPKYGPKPPVLRGPICEHDPLRHPQARMVKR